MKLSKFNVTNYRNIIDSNWIDVASVTAFVGQNEAGKSNLFDALHRLNPYDDADYDIDDDWPADDWKNKKQANGKVVCSAYYHFEGDEAEELFEHASAETVEDEDGEIEVSVVPEGMQIFVQRCYGEASSFSLADSNGDVVDPIDLSLSREKITEWAQEHLPKFVFIQEYDLSGAQVELDQLKARLDQKGGNRHELTQFDQTILIVLDLAEIDLEDVVDKGASPEGRTLRQRDTHAASAYLSEQFRKLWTQKKVSFDIKVDGNTLNIFTIDEAIRFPIPLHRRSTGFRWYVSFAWKFTHASEGEFENCILLLEEPGIHLHYSGQRDLLSTFEGLSETNGLLYTTHLSSMVDQANPERVRIVETDEKHHLKVTHGVVSSQAAPMAVIE